MLDLNKNDQLTFYVSSQGGDSSFRTFQYDEQIKVKTIRLEEFISQKIKLLKLNQKNET